jgi:hypothetical protein
MMKTWDDVIARAYARPSDPMTLDTIGPLFHQAVTLVERGDLTQEQAMIHLALGLAEIATDQQTRLLDLLNTRLPQHVVFPK